VEAEKQKQTQSVKLRMKRCCFLWRFWGILDRGYKDMSSCQIANNCFIFYLIFYNLNT